MCFGERVEVGVYRVGVGGEVGQCNIECIHILVH